MRHNALKEIYKTIDAGTAQEKLENLPNFPKIIELEITNHCNFQCIMCPTGIDTAKRQRGYMSDETYYKLIDEISAHKVALKFVGQGEPLLHQKAIYYMTMARKKGIITHLTTNGSLLSKDMMKRIIEDEALDSIKFSFQGVDSFGYSMLRQKDNFEELINTIEEFYDFRGDKEKPYITIGTSITNETDEEVDAFICKASKISDKVEVGMTQLESSELFHIKNDRYREKLEELQSRQMKSKKRYVCCPHVFDVITVRWNGDIAACCADIDGTMTLGNIKSDTILECWQGEKECSYRKILSEGRYEDIEVCRDCYDVYGWTYGEN